MRKLFTVAMLFSAGAKAQTNFPVLVTAAGCYTNARIVSTTPAYALVFYEGGGAHVPMEQLPESLQKQFHFDPALAAKASAAEKQQREKVRAAAEQQRLDQKSLNDWRGEPVDGFITTIVNKRPSMTRCLVTFSNQSADVWLVNVPARVFSYYAELERLTNAVAKQSSYVEKEHQRLRTLKNNLPSTAPTDTAEGAAIRQFNMDTDALEDEAMNLNKLKSASEHLLLTRRAATHCVFIPTTRSFDQPIWNCE